MMKNSSGRVARCGSSVAGSLRWLIRSTWSAGTASCFEQPGSIGHKKHKKAQKRKLSEAVILSAAKNPVKYPPSHIVLDSSLRSE
jgi:hypothetical protein